MKKIAFFLIICFVFFSCKKKQSTENYLESEKFIIAYVTSWTSEMPNPKYLTHINYAFAHVNDSFDGLRVDNEERLKQIVDLRDAKQSLKILLSVGGWGSGRFSEMAADGEKRVSFATDCKRAIDKFNLDGIDIDWEYPSSDLGGISASPDDINNFTLLLKDIRSAIGEEKLLTIATASIDKYYDFNAIDPYLDFINIMSYDMGLPPCHHSALYPSEMTEMSGHEAVCMHLEQGISPEKLVYGVPFYGKAIQENIKSRKHDDLINSDEFKEKWDDTAKVPYLLDAADEMVYTFENSASIAIKANYVRENNLLGMMFWDYSGDDNELSFQKTIWEELNK